MIALRFIFTAGRYHATPWGRHVNEAALAWPPEPLRILRALIACHHRKANADTYSDDALANLIDTLSEALPIYRLPEAVHAHTRHYMPLRLTTETALVFDAFARFDPEDPLIVGWPNIALDPDQRAHLDHLALRLGYLGRAESWAEAAATEWDGQDANARPLNTDLVQGAARKSEARLVSLYAPLSPTAYRETRERLIHDERERRRAGWKKKAKLTEKALDGEMKDLLATLPERLASALALDTSVLQSVGWSDPPATRRVLYSAPEPTGAWRGHRPRRALVTHPDPTLARFVLAGRPRPQIEDTVKIAEIMRLAAMAKFGWQTLEGRRRPSAPAVISGYGEDRKPLREHNHAHTFWLPEDADGDGEIDHVIVYAAAGLNNECQQKLDLITRLWIAKPKESGDEDERATDSGRAEWRLALEGFGHPPDFASASPLLRSSTKWTSATPYLMPWYAKKRLQWKDQIRRELRERGIPETSEMPVEHPSIVINGRNRWSIHFHRFRSRRGLHQPDTLGRFVELTFEQPIWGPLVLGFGCHFGLGLFAGE